MFKSKHKTGPSVWYIVPNRLIKCGAGLNPNDFSLIVNSCIVNLGTIKRSNSILLDLLPKKPPVYNTFVQEICQNLALTDQNNVSCPSNNLGWQRKMSIVSHFVVKALALLKPQLLLNFSFIFSVSLSSLFLVFCLFLPNYQFLFRKQSNRRN
jgi:hypothetical protein